MFGFRLDKLVRAICGLGMLWLLAAQEKVCPWLLTVPTAAGVNRPAAAPGSESTSPKKKPAKKILPHVLPDATAPRWPAGWDTVAFRQTTGLRDGVTSCGQPDPTLSRVVGGAWAADATPGWKRDLRRLELHQWIRPGADLLVLIDPSVRFCLMRTGPPHA